MELMRSRDGDNENLDDRDGDNEGSDDGDGDNEDLDDGAYGGAEISNCNKGIMIKLGHEDNKLKYGEEFDIDDEEEIDNYDCLDTTPPVSVSGKNNSHNDSIADFCCSSRHFIH